MALLFAGRQHGPPVKLGGDEREGLPVTLREWEARVVRSSFHSCAFVARQDQTEKGAGLKRLRALAKEIVDAGPPALSSALFVYRDEKFVRFDD
jgi:hypothetical protein